MKILIAPDSFKNSLSSINVAKSIEKGLKSVLPNAEFVLCALADGGEGTVQAMISNTNGTIINVECKDPLLRSINSFYGILGDQKTAVIEMAASSGIELLAENERNPWVTSTFGTGLLIKDALDKGCKKIILGIGGSATNDCGAGMAYALGAKFYNNFGILIEPSGGTIGEITQIDLSGFDNRIFNTEIVAACDVTNPLFGKNGAAYIYSPQKGADEIMVQKLDANLQHFNNILINEFGTDVSNTPGAGAAGGMGAGILTFLKGNLKPGFKIISDTIELESIIKSCDLIITGEGKIDYQTQYGKVPFSIAQIAKKYSIPVIAFGGTIDNDSEKLLEHGISSIIPIVEKPCSLEFAIINAEQLLENAAKRVGQIISIFN